MGIEAIFPQPVTIAGIQISDTVVFTWIIVGTLSILAAIAYKRYRVWEPSGWQLVIELMVEYVEGLISDTVGENMPETVAYLTTMISFLIIANLFGLLPLMQAPTRDLNTTLALSIVSLVSVHYFGMREHGVKHQLLSYFRPVAFMFPLNVIGEVSRVISMALRLFGNVIATEIVGFTFFMLMPPLAPIPMYLLGMITGLLQALVFTVLTLVFIADALQEET